MNSTAETLAVLALVLLASLFLLRRFCRKPKPSASCGKSACACSKPRGRA